VTDAASPSVGVAHWRTSIAASDAEISEETLLIQKDVDGAYEAGKVAPSPTAGPVPPGPAPGPGGLTSTGTTAAPRPPVSASPKPVGAGTVLRIIWKGDVPPQKWMNFDTKVLSKFSTGAGLKLTLYVEVAPPDGLSTQKVEETRVALRELGIENELKGE